MANTFMMHKTVITALIFSLCVTAQAAALYQWQDSDGSTRLTAEAPPAHATHIRRVFQDSPPPMSAKVVQPATASSSILTPQDPYASRRLQNSIDQMRAEEDSRRQRALAEEEARNYELRAADEDYNYGYEADPSDYNGYYSYSQSPSISASSGYRRANDMATGLNPYGMDTSTATSRAAADASGKAADTVSKAANAIGSVLGKR